MAKYNHMFSICFTVENDTKDNASTKELIAGLEKRLTDLKANGDEIEEACGAPHDTFELTND